MSKNDFSDENTMKQIAHHYREIIKLIGEDVERDGLRKTPERAAKALLYCTRGYRQDVNAVINDAMFECSSAKNLVVVKDIEFYSLCEHHILPFFGHVSVGYLPGEKIVGLSKIARIVDMYARRLQVQETLAGELAAVLADVLQARGVIVQCSARHLCMSMRGVGKQDSVTVTTAATGVLQSDSSLRSEFFTSIKK